MATLQELSIAFNRYRKRSNRRYKRAKYPKELTKAVMELRQAHKDLTLKEIANAVGVGIDTVKRWTNEHSKSSTQNKFAPVAILDGSRSQNVDELKISNGSVTISVLPNADQKKVYELIKILVAG